MLQFGLLGPLLSLIEGPVFSIIDKLIPDPSLKAKLKAEIKVKAIAHDDQVTKAQRDILMQEISHGSLLTRSWRPVLMYLIILFLLIYGFLLPLADLFTHKPIVFKPRWHELPVGLWNLLSLGVGGYIGGRSLEKITASYVGSKSGFSLAKPGVKAAGWRRKNNFNSA